MPQTVVVLTSGTSWTVPAGVINLDFVDCIGAGGSGAAICSLAVSNGGGGGAFSRITNFTVSPGQVLTYSLGVGGTGVSATGNNGGVSPAIPGNAGTDTWFVNTATCLAKGGSAGSVGTTAPSVAALGGQASACVGTIKYNGGNSGINNTGTFIALATGGGGAGGPNGVGGNGASQGSAGGSTGGTGDAGLGGAGSVGNSLAAGGAGLEYNGVSGSGGGSGGASFLGSTFTNAIGGSFGAGSGGAQTNNTGTPTATSGRGGHGLIAIAYTLINPTGFNMPMLGM